MVFSKKNIFLSLTILMVALSGCSLGKKETVNVETVLPEDSTLVMVLDYSSDEQVGNLKKLMSGFPELGLKKAFVEGFDESAGAGTFDKSFAPVLAGDWKMAFGGMIADDFDFQSFMQDPTAFNWDELDGYIVAYFEEADLLEKSMMDLAAKDGMPVVKKEISGKEGFFSFEPATDGGGFLVRHGDLFFLTPTEKARDAAIERIIAKKGFSLEGKVDAKADVQDDYLGYVYADGDSLMKVLEDIYVASGMSGELIEQMAGAKWSYAAFTAEKDGFRVSSVAKIDGEKNFYTMYKKGDFSLADKVIGEGNMMFLEVPTAANMLDVIFLSLNNDPVMQSVIMGAAVGVESEVAMDDVDMEAIEVMEGDETNTMITEEDGPFEVSSVDFDEIPAATGGQKFDFEAYFYDELLPYTTLSKEEFVSVLDNPMAFTMGDSSGLVPTMGFYLSFKDADKAAVGKLMAALNGAISQGEALLKQEIEASGRDSQFLVKDTVKVGAVEINRVYLDWSKMPAEGVAEMKAILGESFADQLKMEFYYGVTDDNVMVLALQPNFGGLYGKKTLADSAAYKDALKKVDGEGSVAYINLDQVATLVDRYLVLVEKFAPLQPEDKEIFSKVRAFMGQLHFAVADYYYEDGYYYERSFIGIGK